MLNLTPEQLELVQHILAEHVPGIPVKAFGSRVNGQARSYSDLDLVLIGETQIERKVLSQIEEAFEFSDLPFRVDVLDWHRLTPAFQAVIERSSVYCQPPPSIL